MASLEHKLHSALGKKGAATKKQVKAEESIAKQQEQIFELQQKLLKAGGVTKTNLTQQLKEVRLTISKDRLDLKKIMADVRDATTTARNVKKKIEQAEKTKLNIQKAEARLQEKAAQKAKREQERFNQARKGTKKETISYGADGLAQTSYRVSKAMFATRQEAEEAAQKSLAKIQSNKNFVPGSERTSFSRGKNGTWSFDLSAQAQEQAPSKSISARIWDGVKLAAESIKEVIEKIINGLKKFLGGIAKFVKGLYRFGKNVLKIALGLPLFTALFSKLASLNGLNAMEFAGRSTGAGNAVTDRGLKIFENMYGTDGSLSNIAANRMDLVSNPANLRFLQMIGMSDEEIKNKDANMFALSYAKKLSSWFQTQSGMSLDEIRKNPTDSRVRSAYSAYNASGLGDKMSVASLLGYENAFKNGLDKELESYSKGEHRLYKLINEQNGLKQERGYQASIIEWQNMWIKLATKIQPYMSEISDGLARLASGFIDLLFNNGGFQKMVDIFMSAFRKLTAWLKSKEVQEQIKNILNWMGSKLEGAWNFLTTKDASGKTGLDIITETLSGLWATLKEILGHIADIALWIGDKLGLTNYSKMQDKYGFLKMGRLDIFKSMNLGGLDYKYEDMLLRNGGVNNRAYQQRRKENQINLQDMMADIKPEIIKNMTAGEAQAYLDAMVAGNKINPYGNDQEKYNYVVFESILSVLQSINGKINTSTPLRVSAQGNGF